MRKPSSPPAAFQDFVRRFPRLGAAWGLASEEGRHGPLDKPTRQLVKLAVAVGALREGAVHSAVRKALDAGIAPEALEQVVALAASTIGFPPSVAAWCWVRDVLAPGGRKPGSKPGSKKHKAVRRRRT